MAHGAFMPACAGSHLVDTPTARLEGEMLDKLAVIICRDWERAAVRMPQLCRLPYICRLQLCLTKCCTVLVFIFVSI